MGVKGHGEARIFDIGGQLGELPVGGVTVHTVGVDGYVNGFYGTI